MSPLKRGTKPLQRKTRLTADPAKAPRRTGKLKAVNRKRRESEFARCYGSRARVAFIKALPCVWCGRMPSDNAHTVTGGKGRKADADTIAPLCSGMDGCHRKYDEHRFPFDIPGARQTVKNAAPITEALWQLYLSRTGQAA